MLRVMLYAYCLSLVLLAPGFAPGQQLQLNNGFTPIFITTNGLRYFATTNFSATRQFVERLEGFDIEGNRFARQLDSTVTSALRELDFPTAAERAAFLVNAAYFAITNCVDREPRRALVNDLMWRALDADPLDLPTALMPVMVNLMADDVSPHSRTAGFEPMPVQRIVRTEWMLYALETAESQVDESYDPSAPSNIPQKVAPLGGGIAGMSPGLIRDPILRAQYEDMLRVEREKAERNTRESALHKYRENVRNEVASFVAVAYAQRPYDPEGLASLVRAHVKRPEVQSMLVSASRQYLPANWQKHAYQGEFEGWKTKLPRPFGRASASIQTASPQENTALSARNLKFDSRIHVAGSKSQFLLAGSVSESNSEVHSDTPAAANRRAVLLWSAVLASLVIVIGVTWRAQARAHTGRPK